MADLQPARIEPLGDSPELPVEGRPERSPKAKPSVKPLREPPPLDAEAEEKHQLDEQA